MENPPALGNFEKATILNLAIKGVSSASPGGSIAGSDFESVDMFAREDTDDADDFLVELALVDGISTADVLALQNSVNGLIEIGLFELSFGLIGPFLTFEGSSASLHQSTSSTTSATFTGTNAVCVDAEQEFCDGFAALSNPCSNFLLQGIGILTRCESLCKSC
jgi:hypothetical protein